MHVLVHFLSLKTLSNGDLRYCIMYNYVPRFFGCDSDRPQPLPTYSAPIPHVAFPSTLLLLVLLLLLLLLLKFYGTSLTSIPRLASSPRLASGGACDDETC